MTTATLSNISKTSSIEQLDAIAAVFVARQSRSRDDSLSVEDQIAKGEQWAAAQSPPVLFTNVYVERDVSGRRPLEKRKGLRSAVEDIESGRAEMIVTAYFDRFVRSVATRAEVVTRVEKKGGVVMTLDMGATSNATAADKLSGTLLAAIAEFYADQVGEKLMTSKQRRIDAGKPPFPRITPAYVRLEDGTLMPHPQNAPLVRKAIKMRIAGKSFVAIHRFLVENGIEIGLSGVESMLASKLLIGEIHFGDFVPNLTASEKWTADASGRTTICDRATFRKMHETKGTRGRYSKSERLLARLDVLTCKSCGSRMTVHSSRNSAGKSYPYYRCGRRHECAAPASVACDVAEQKLIEETIALAADLKGRASAQRELEAARVEREDVEQRLAETIATLTSLGLMGEPASKKSLAELSSERDAKVARHERLVLVTTPDKTVNTIDDWNRLSFDAKRALIHAVVAVASVTPGRGSDRVQVIGKIVSE